MRTICTQSPQGPANEAVPSASYIKLDRNGPIFDATVVSNMDPFMFGKLRFALCFSHSPSRKQVFKDFLIFLEIEGNE